MEGMHSDFLYARPSFFEGMARIMDIGGTLNEYNASRTGAEADVIALMMDWNAVGQDLRRAIGEYETEEADELELVG